MDLHFELDLCPADNIFCHPAEQIVSLPTDNIFCHLADIFLLLIIDNSFVIPLIIFFYHPADFTVHCLFLLQRLCIYMLSRLYHGRIHRRTQGRHFHLFFSANCCGLTSSNKAPFLCNISLDPNICFVKSMKTAVGCPPKSKILWTSITKKTLDLAQKYINSST